MFFLSFIFFLNTQSYQVVWHHQDIYIPLETEVTPYTLLPYVEVYQNNEVLEDIEIFYQRGVERTFLSVIQSREVKTYHIKYRVYIPSINYDEIVTISFHIVDLIPPEVTVLEDIKFVVNQKIDILKFLTIKDNYYAKDVLHIIIDFSKVDVSKVGNFEVNIRVKDPSGNETVMTIPIEIYDNQAPSITLIKQFVIEPNTKMNLLDYIKVKDDVDHFIKIILDDAYVMYDQIGTYPIWIHAIDQSGNQSSISHELEIKDRIKPVLKVVSSTPIIEVHEEITNEHIQSYVVEFYDNFDHNPKLSWIEDIDASKIGTYNIEYSGIDQSLNEIHVTLKIIVQDTIAPDVSVKDNLVIDVYSNVRPILTYFMVEDNYYAFEELTIQIKSSIDVEKVGIYEVLLEVSDPSKNKKTYRFYMHVMDRTPPILIQNEPIIISNFMRPSYDDILMFEDQYDKKSDIYLVIKDDHIDYLHMGHHDMNITLMDSSLNEAEYMIQIIIMDLSPPILTLSHTEVYIDIEKFSFHALDYIATIEDNQITLTLEDVIVIGDVKREIGTYVVMYEVFDVNGLSDSVSLIVKVMDYSSPHVEVEDIRLKYGEVIDREKGITISDQSQYQLIHLNTFDSNQLGHHVMYYVAYDIYGNETFFKRTITVEKSGILQELEPYYESMFILSIGSLLTFLLWFYYARRAFDKNPTFEYNETMIENN